jgi:hypothetical protein
MMSEIHRLKDQSNMGLAVISGHQAVTKSLRW